MIEQLPNTIILNIIKSVDSNVDLICLLSTCKRLFYNIIQQYNATLQFKHIQYFQEGSSLFIQNEQLVKSLKSFRLQSFKSLFNNALSNQMVVSDDQDRLPSFCHFNSSSTAAADRLSLFISTNNLDDTIRAPSTTRSIDITCHLNRPLPSTLFQGIENLEKLLISSEYTSTERIISDKLPETLKCFSIYYKYPSCIEGGAGGGGEDSFFPLGIEKIHLTGNDDVTTSLNSLGLEKLGSLDTLSVGPVVITESPPLFISSPSPPSILPSSLTSLDLGIKGNIPSDLFQSLVSLEDLSINMHQNGDAMLNLDLTHLHALKNFSMFTSCSELFTDATIKLPLSSSLKSIFISDFYKLSNLSTLFFPTTLEKLDMYLGPTDYETVQLPKSLTRIAISPCQVPIPVGFIPSGVKSLSISSYDSREVEILPGSIPSSVETLSLIGYDGPTTSEYFPDSIKHLTWDRQSTTQALPPALEKLLWGYATSISGDLSCALPSTIQQIEYHGVVQFPLPPSLTKLECQFDPTCHIDNSYYSISKLNYCQKKQQDGPLLLLPSNQRKLKINMEGIVLDDKDNPNHISKFSFRLDQVINQTNIEKLTINIYGMTWFKATIKRLEKDNSRVLIVDNKSLFGGIISQSRNRSNNNEYPPIYLYNDNHYQYKNEDLSFCVYSVIVALFSVWGILCRMKYQQLFMYLVILPNTLLSIYQVEKSLLINAYLFLAPGFNGVMQPSAAGGNEFIILGGNYTNLDGSSYLPIIWTYNNNSLVQKSFINKEVSVSNFWNTMMATYDSIDNIVYVTSMLANYDSILLAYDLCQHKVKKTLEHWFYPNLNVN
ncbi:hypothetical protein DFA_07949 [Cavenderia fasciculata]|uniref:Uncharacterized protein n=1 Tax=Cavenderia fasciculata TaxID=261658 RepID=F4Q4A6_CACFS|nr:uncharacterized protein DFA_07949 [Cavenderia fasciculata]EGG16968.1 hypothetical protein DFA_07949 [Cavenderia fasciculata]|eukprot:XP_004355442.1 hypothetical protein DFA_07949 [Cavenderia fasciculata]